MIDLQRLREKTDDIAKTIEAAFAELEDLDRKRSDIELYERDTRELEKTLLDKGEKLTLERQKLEDEKEGLKQKREELFALAKKLERSEDQFIKTKEQIEIMEDKIAEMKGLDIRLTDKRKDIDRREEEITKQIEIDRQRKLLLNVREAKIKRREQQLQMEASI